MPGPEQRANAVNDLSEYLGEIVTVVYFEAHGRTINVEGRLKENKPFRYIVLEGKGSIPFIGWPDAIQKIKDGEGKILYDNAEHITGPDWNPYYENGTVTDRAKYIRKLRATRGKSFGPEHNE